MSAIFESKRRTITIATFIGIFLLFLASKASADMDVQFPVAELGNCGSKEECYTYCEISENMDACLAFAEKNQLMDQKEIREARKFVAAGSKGPGGCTGKKSCETYCNNVAHMSECLAFAEKTGMMSDEEMEEAKKIAAYLDKGGQLPGGCSSREECDSYCGGSDPAKMKECINFAMSAGFMSEEEAKEIDKVMTALDKGVRPPKCRGDEECAVYCSQTENVEECAAFMLASGMATPREVELLRKTGGKGPGGCVGKACETFCDDPVNKDVCTNYALQNGFISKEEYEGRGEGRGRFKKDFETMPAGVQSCLRNSIGTEVDKMLADNPPSSETREKMNSCFEQMRPPSDEFSRPAEEGSSYRGEGRPSGDFRPPTNYPNRSSGEYSPMMDGSSGSSYGRERATGEFARPMDGFTPPINEPQREERDFSPETVAPVRPQYEHTQTGTDMPVAAPSFQREVQAETVPTDSDERQ